MADTKISALTAAAAVADANEIPINEAGTTKKITALQLRAYSGDGLFNASVADQAISATTAYVAGSNIAVPVGLLRIKTAFRWTLHVTKSAAGVTAGCAILFKLGTLGTTGDATILTFTFGTPTGVADTAIFDVLVIIRGPLSASCIATGAANMAHNLAATGFSTLPNESKQATSGTFNATTANLIAGLTITTTTLSVWTVTGCYVEAMNL
jgi:hypothetical protein